MVFSKHTEIFLKCYFNTVCIKHIYGFILIDIERRKGEKKINSQNETVVEVSN